MRRVLAALQECGMGIGCVECGRRAGRSSRHEIVSRLHPVRISIEASSFRIIHFRGFIATSEFVARCVRC
jgi:hypothetical protein